MSDVTGAPRLDELLADAYRGASLQGLDMLAVARSFEVVRAESAGSDDSLVALMAIQHAIAVATADSAVTALSALRTRLEDDILRAASTRIGAASAHAPDSALGSWVAALAAAHCRGTSQLAMRFTEWPIVIAPAVDAAIDELRRLSRFVSRRRWDSAYPLFERLGNDPAVAPGDRAMCIETTAMIQLHVLQAPLEARRRLELAETQDPACAQVHAGWAEFWLEQGRAGPDRDLLGKANESARQALRFEPRQGRALLALGDVAALASDLAADGLDAAAWYRRAVAAGTSAACVALLKLALDRGERRADELAESYLAQATRIDPDCECEHCLGIAGVFFDAGHVETADEWHVRAIALEPGNALAYVQRGYRRHIAGDAETAGKMIDRAVELAPDAFDVWYTRGYIAEADRRFGDAVASYERSLALRPEWEVPVRTRIAECLRLDADWASATEHLFIALQKDPQELTVLSELLSLAADEYQTRDDVDAAVKIYDRVRDVLGPGYEAAYRNLLGNLRFFMGDFEAATVEYERSVAIEPSADVLGNLAGAWERRAAAGEREEGLDRAADAIRRALELNPDDAFMKTRLAALDRDRRIARDYGVKALDRVNVTNPIRVLVAPEHLQFILDLRTKALTQELLDEIEAMRERVFSASGVRIPGVRFVDRDPPIEGEPTVSIFVNAVGLGVATIPVDARFAFATATQLEALGIAAARPGRIGGREGFWVPPAAALEVLTVGGAMLQEVEHTVRPHLGEFVTHELVRESLTSVANQRHRVAAERDLTLTTALARAIVTRGHHLGAFDDIAAAVAVAGSHHDMKAMLAGLLAAREPVAS